MIKLYLNRSILTQLFLGLLVFLFIFVLFFRGTIAFSYIVLFLFLFLLINPKVIEKKDVIFFLKNYKKPFFFILFFFIWIILQPFIVSGEQNIFSEIKSQFIVPILFCISGILLVLSKFKYLNYYIIFNLIFYAGFLHVCIVIIMALFEYFALGYLPVRTSYLLEIREMSYFTNLVYAFFLAEIYIRLQKNKSFLFFNNLLIPLFLLIFIFSVYLQGMRWGVITFCLSSVFFFIIYFLSIKMVMLKKLLTSIIFILLLFGLFFMNLKYDKRWDSILETINITMNDNSLYWVNKNEYPCPKLSNGECVDLSNYLRLKQFIEGLKLVKDYPLGRGYSRHAYQELIIEIYHDDKESFNFPHSGIINLFIGVGFIGIFLYMGFNMYIVLKLINLESSYPKIFTIFFIVSFHTRSFVDMTFMNHNLKLYFFILGIGLVSALLENERIKNEKTKTN